MSIANPKVPSNLNLNNYVLTLLEKCNHLNHLKQLQVFLITLGHGYTQFFTAKLVRFSAFELDNLDYARYIFDNLTSPNVFLYTVMITAYVSHSDHRSALVLYRDMIRRGRTQPNHFVFPQVLKSCSGVSESWGAQSVHTQILKLGFGGYPIVQTSLVDTYSRLCSDIGSARQVFDGMCERSIVAWTAMIFGYARVGEMGNAVVLFEEMPARDVPSWNAVIAGCTQNGLFTEAISFFRRMIILGSRDERPNQVTVACILSASCHLGMLQLGRWVHGYVYRNGLGLNSFVSNALVDMYGKCGSLKEARKILDRISNKSLMTWNSMINCLALHGQSESAIGVFEEMIACQNVIRPDGID